MRHQLTRRTVLQLASSMPLLVAGSLLSGCPQRTQYTSPKGIDKGTASGFGNARPKPTKVGLVTDIAGVNDKSFNAMAALGLERVRTELKLPVKIIESRQNADYVNNLSQLARAGYEVVFAVGFLMRQAVNDVAARFPDTTFIIIDAESPSLSNCAGIQYREEEGCFLVGYLGALMSTTGVLGFVGGLDVPLIKKFEVAYQAGAIHARKDVEIRVGYAGSFDDPQKGQEIAKLQLSTKADVIFHAAGKTGIGVIKAIAASPKGSFAIGTDRNQDGDAPGRVLTSLVKRVDLAVFESVDALLKGTFTPGSITKGLKEKWIDLTDFAYTKDAIGPERLAKLEACRKDILAGTIRPPMTQVQFDAYVKAAEKS